MTRCKCTRSNKCTQVWFIQTLESDSLDGREQELGLDVTVFLPTRSNLTDLCVFMTKMGMDVIEMHTLSYRKQVLSRSVWSWEEFRLQYPGKLACC